MAITIGPAFRAPAIGIGAAALVIGSFLLGTAQSGTASAGQTGVSGPATSASSGKITVTGSGTVTGVPNQLVLSMGVQTTAGSVSLALHRANAAADKVISALEKNGVAKSDIQTSDLSIQPNFHGSSGVPVSYGVSEQLTATLTDLSKAGTQIQKATDAGGDAVVVNDVSLNLTDTSGLLAAARSKAVHDAQAKATQFANALHETLQGVVSVSDQTSQFSPLPDYYNVALPAASGHVPVSPGTQKVSVQITVVYAIG
jgi:uncharacterized protein